MSVRCDKGWTPPTVHPSLPLTCHSLVCVPVVRLDLFHLHLFLPFCLRAPLLSQPLSLAHSLQQKHGSLSVL
uniref:Uncharacterized protein n=1 Tax=Anguilla anguilla TaxID=7936 RepID=A0A0E9PNG8_ANGAN